MSALSMIFGPPPAIVSSVGGKIKIPNLTDVLLGIRVGGRCASRQPDAGS